MLDELEKAARPISDASLQAQARTKTIFHFYKQQKRPHLRLAGSAEILCPLIKISRGGYTRKITDESPIILLDDVMSELDDGRQELLLERLGKRQVFITCCDPSQLLRLQKGKAFEITDGSINEI